MDRKFTSLMETKLKQMHDEIIDSLSQYKIERLEQLEQDSGGDEVDVAEVQLDSETLALLGSRERRHLEAIRAALFRIQANTYGRCVSCGAPIPEGRLEAMPEAARCVACKRKAERVGGPLATA